MIEMECLSPKRAKCERNFAGFEDFALWVVAEINGGKGKVGRLISPLAERGELTVSNKGCDIHATSDFHVNDYFVLREMQRRTGVLKPGAGGDLHSGDPASAMNFAKELDKLDPGQEDSP